LGDILLTTPLLRSLKKKYPDISIDFLIREEFRDAVGFNPNLDQIITLEKNYDLAETIQSLKTNEYNLIIDLQNNFRTKNIVQKLKLQTLRFIKPNIKKFILVHFKVNLLKEQKPIPQRYADVIPGFKLDSDGLDLFYPEKIKSELDSKSNFIGLIPGAFHFTKRWLLDYYIELGNKLINEGFKVVIFGGQSDREICAELHSAIAHSVDLSNDNNLFQTAEDMKQCKVVVCNDSGLMHTAAAVKVPVISIFGSTVKEFGFTPYGIRNLVLENNSLSCRPCSHIGKDTCPKKHFNCMKEITPDHVYNELQKFIKV